MDPLTYGIEFDSYPSDRNSLPPVPASWVEISFGVWMGAGGGQEGRRRYLNEFMKEIQKIVDGTPDIEAGVLQADRTAWELSVKVRGVYRLPRFLDSDRVAKIDAVVGCERCGTPIYCLKFPRTPQYGVGYVCGNCFMSFVADASKMEIPVITKTPAKEQVERSLEDRVNAIEDSIGDTLSPVRSADIDKRDFKPGVSEVVKKVEPDRTPALRALTGESGKRILR